MTFALDIAHFPVGLPAEIRVVPSPEIWPASVLGASTGGSREWLLERDGGRIVVVSFAAEATSSGHGSQRVGLENHVTASAPSPRKAKEASTFNVSNSSPSDVHKLRRLTGLTYDQVADLMGVSRRSVHNWAAGGRMYPTHKERLGRLLAAIREVDRGTQGATGELLFSSPEGVMGFDLLKSRSYDEFVKTVGRGTLRPQSKAPKIGTMPILGVDPRGWLEALVASEEGDHKADEPRILTQGKKRPLTIRRR